MTDDADLQPVLAAEFLDLADLLDSATEAQILRNREVPTTRPAVAWPAS